MTTLFGFFSGSVIERLKRIKDILLGRESSILTEIRDKQDTTNVRLLHIEERLGEIETLVQEIHDAVGEPELEADVTFSAPTTKPASHSHHHHHHGH